jgi:FtsH-binding integral membrane protein
MTDIGYDPSNTGPGSFFKPGIYQLEQAFITRVFNWMFLGLMASALVAYYVSTNELIIKSIYSNPIIMIVLAVGLFGLVWNISANVHKMSPQAAAANFFIYAALNGVLLSSVFIIYTSASIFSTFCIAGATFGVMALYGATTKKDLTGMGSFLFMALIGLIIAQLVNMFLHNSGLDSVLTYVGVIIFIGLTAYDVQKIKQIGQSGSYHPNLAINGALALYLDFINLFLYLLRIFGSRRED